MTVLAIHVRRYATAAQQNYGSQAMLKMCAQLPPIFARTEAPNTMIIVEGLDSDSAMSTCTSETAAVLCWASVGLELSPGTGFRSGPLDLGLLPLWPEIPSDAEVCC